MLRAFPVIGVFLSICSLLVRSLQKFLQKGVSAPVKAIYITALLSMAALNLTNFIITGTISFALLALSTVVTRLFVDLIDLAISHVNYLKTSKSYRDQDLCYQLNLSALEIQTEHRDQLICQRILLMICLKGSPENQSIVQALAITEKALKNTQANIDKIKLPFLQAKEAEQKARYQRTTTMRMSSFSALCLTFLALPMLISFVNPMLGLGLFIAFELFECIAISNIAYRLYKAYHPTPSAKERYQQEQTDNERVLQESSTKLYQSLSNPEKELANESRLSELSYQAKEQRDLGFEEKRIMQAYQSKNQHRFFFYAEPANADKSIELTKPSFKQLG